MFLDDGVGALAVLHHLFEIVFQMPVNSSTSPRTLLIERDRLSTVIQLVRSVLADSAEKLLTKLSGFLISCAMPAVSWPSDASFCRLDEAILRGAQFRGIWRGRWCVGGSSLRRRAFSIAITTCLAKVVQYFDLLSVNGRISWR